MLEHLSPKFKMPPMEREPRAALILNRFTRNLTIMFATSAVSSILGLHPDEIREKSFYRCIQEKCLPEALRCLEGAKENDSIAYLRFWSRDPREEAEPMQDEVAEDGFDEQAGLRDSEGGGAQLDVQMEIDQDDLSLVDIKQEFDSSMEDSGIRTSTALSSASNLAVPGLASGTENLVAFAAFAPSASAGTQGARSNGSPGSRRPRRREVLPSIELEAVVSCTSDGLVVVLRKARPRIPALHPPQQLPLDFENGLFAAPWAQQPIRPYVPPETVYTFQPPLLPQDNVKTAEGPPLDQLMRSIRDVAVFAWALVGINDNFSAYGRGIPRGEAQPQDSRAAWDHQAGGDRQGHDSQVAHSWNKGKAPAASAAQYGSLYQPEAQQGPSGFDNYTYGSSPTWLRRAGGLDARHQAQQDIGMHSAYWVQEQEQNPQKLPAPVSYGLQQNAWIEPTQSARNPIYAIPTTTPEAQRRGEAPHEFRYSWQ